jgi:hypothetical protein
MSFMYLDASTLQDEDRKTYCDDEEEGDALLGPTAGVD